MVLVGSCPTVGASPVTSCPQFSSLSKHTEATGGWFAVEDSTVSLTDDPDDDADPEWLQVGGVVPLSEAASKATRAHRRAAKAIGVTTPAAARAGDVL